MSLALIGIALAQGFVGSWHCVGMCGPFVHILASGGSSADGPQSQSQSDAQSRTLGPVDEGPRTAPPAWFTGLIYNFGRSLSYMSLGALFGFLGERMNLSWLEQSAGVVGAMMILVFGLLYAFPEAGAGMGVLKLPGRLSLWLSRRLGNSGRVTAGFALGAGSGLLPCGLLYPAYGLALATGRPLDGALVMFAFSLGAYPALLTVAGLSNWFYRKPWAPQFRRIAGILMIVTGLAMVLIRFLHVHAMGHHQHHG